MRTAPLTPIDALDEVGEELRLAAAELDFVLVNYPRCPHIFRLRAGEAAADILRFLVMFREAHLHATAEVDEDVRRLHEIATLLASGRPPEPERLRAADRLIVAYKALYFFIRAYQDRLYTILSLVLRPDSSPGHSMENAFGKNRMQNPVRAFLDAELPEYVEWFPTWRNQRNEVKDGVSFSTGGPAPEIGLTSIGIRFNEFTRDGGVSVDCSQAVQLSDVIHALRMSAALATKAVGALHSSNQLSGREDV